MSPRRPRGQRKAPTSPSKADQRSPVDEPSDFELSNPTEGGEQAERTEHDEPLPGNVSGPRNHRPDLRAARTETRLRRWALVLLVTAPAVYVIIQRVA